MVRLSLLLALAGVAAANTPTRGYQSQARSKSIGLRGVDSKILTARDTCSTFEEDCDNYCMPSTGECCSSGNGAYCELGDYCVSGGCCQIGKICTGDATTCDIGKELCGNSCIPEGATCCSDGRYCDAGDVCTSDGRCDSSASESGGSHRTSIDAFPTATGGSGSGSIFDDDDGDDEDNSTSTADDTGSGSTLCKRKGSKSGGGSFSGGDDDDDDEDGGDGGDDCEGDGASAGSIVAPSVFALLFAAAVAML